MILTAFGAYSNRAIFDFEIESRLNWGLARLILSIQTRTILGYYKNLILIK